MSKIDRKILAALRRLWLYSSERYQVLKASKQGLKYKCSKCNRCFDKVHVDHIDPVIDVKKGFQGWDIFVKRLFVAIERLQVLCERCHARKTKSENSKRT